MDRCVLLRTFNFNNFVSYAEKKGTFLVNVTMTFKGFKLQNICTNPRKFLNLSNCLYKNNCVNLLRTQHFAEWF